MAATLFFFSMNVHAEEREEKKENKYNMRAKRVNS